MSLSKYIRSEQEFDIYLYNSEFGWQVYDLFVHGNADAIDHDYAVAYKGGEILACTAELAKGLPPGTHYIHVVPWKVIRMPVCKDSDPRIEIEHVVSKYHKSGRYCTRLCNVGDVAFKVIRFASFSKGFFGRCRLSTISGDWFSHEQFVCWYNVKSGWIQPGCEVADHDNYGFGRGYWVFEIEFEGQGAIFIRSKLPKRSF